MGAISVVFDPGGRVGGGIAVAANMVTFLDDQYGLIQLVSDTFGGNGSQESASDDDVGILRNIHPAI